MEGRTSKKRGRLKIYLGMAAGVGKTYSMLADARADVGRGQEVVIGYLQAHGRKETEDLADGLERIPLRIDEHRGVRLEEFDLDAAIIRGPKVLLVDELAHSNAPGSRHAKRWQDVAELIERGIDVRTTINVQHIESLRDVVAQITGVFVQETVPDSFIELVDEVELVDIPPEELHTRLEEGKVYIPEKVDQAITGFFKKSNLLALRELALRHTAERVDVQMRQSRALQDVKEPWHANERILVCLGPNQMAPRVVRAAKRLSANLHAELIAVWVESPRQAGLSDEARARLEGAMKLAESLGARTVSLAGDDIVSEVLRFAEAENVTTIVLGKPVRKRWREIIFGSVVDQLVRSSGEIDVMVITGAEEQGTPLIIRRKREPSTGYGMAATLAMLAGCTGIGFLMVGRFELANIVMLYLVAIVIASVRYGRREAITASILGVALFDFCFVPPQGTFAVTDIEYLVTFTIMLGVSLLISSLTLRLKEQTRASSIRERETAALYDLSRRLASAESPTEMAALVARKAADVCQGFAAVFGRDAEGRAIPMAESSSGFERSPKEEAVVAWVLENGRPAGKGTDTLAGSEGVYLPLMGTGKCIGAIGLRKASGEPLEPSSRHMIEAVAHQLVVALDRLQFSRESQEAGLRVEREKLRSSLLSSVSHDLRTPLASIEGAAGILAEKGTLDSDSRELAETVREEAERLGRLVRNLLDMTRVEGGAVELNLDWYGLDELIANAIRFTGSQFEKPVRVDLGPQLPLIKVDGVLVQQVFVNLLENAARHAGASAEVRVAVSADANGLQIDVTDDGPGIPLEDLDRVFDKFRRSGSAGFGLGLAICRAIVEAHDGTIVAMPAARGAHFRLTFPRTEEPGARSG